MKIDSVILEPSNLIVKFDNGHVCGRLEWDSDWKYYKFLSNSPKQPFHENQLRDIAKLIEWANKFLKKQ